MRSGRISCIVPFCRCTADARKFAADTEIICAKHWRLVPAQTKARYRTLKKRKAKIWKAVYGHKLQKPGRLTLYYQAQDAVQRCWARAKAEAIERAAGL